MLMVGQDVAQVCNDNIILFDLVTLRQIYSRLFVSVPRQLEWVGHSFTLKA